MKFLLSAFLLASLLSAHGQGEIILSSFGLTKADRLGTYDLPIFLDENFNGVGDPGEGIGTVAARWQQNAYIGLALNGSIFATAKFFSNELGAYIGEPAFQTVTVPGAPPGATPTLQVRVWIGPAYDDSLTRYEWTLTTQPLGGQLPSGLPGFPADLGGLGPESGAGIAFMPWLSRPLPHPDEITRNTGQDVMVSIAALLANDHHPKGITFLSVDPQSQNGAAVERVGDNIIYRHKHGVEGVDSFNCILRTPFEAQILSKVTVRTLDTEGVIYFSNRLLRKQDGSGTFSIPIWVDGNLNDVRDPAEGIGFYSTFLLQEGATLGLFLRGSDIPFATLPFGTDGDGEFAGPQIPAAVPVPNHLPGQSADLTVKVWTGASYEAAALKHSWDFTSLPLGGQLANAEAVAAPDLNGWLDESGAGFKFTPAEHTIDGEINFGNLNILKADGTDAYSVPIYIDLNANGADDLGEGIGSLAGPTQPATLALYLRGQTTPLATSRFFIDRNGAFAGDPPFQSVKVPGFPPGSRAPLTIKAWIGVSYEERLLGASWDFDSKPLGGPAVNQPPRFPPDVTGWGPENGAGYALSPGGPPTAANDVVTRASGQDVSIPFATLLANDVATIAGALTIHSVEGFSANGARVELIGQTLVYRHAYRDERPDSFNYTVRNALGGQATARVDVKVQDAAGMNYFSNRGLRKADGSGEYNVPIWMDLNYDGIRDSGEAFGSYSMAYFVKPATLALFVRGSETPFATIPFLTAAVEAQWAGNAIPSAFAVPASAPGDSVELTVQAWVGDTLANRIVMGSWDIPVRQLGGTRADFAQFIVPDLSGWGAENSSGFILHPGPAPVAATDTLLREFANSVTFPIADLLTNDTDTVGGGLSFTHIDSRSARGFSIVNLGGGNFRYSATGGQPDHFFYSIRTAWGGTARGRVDVRIHQRDGVINFQTSNIARTNSPATYNVPIWFDRDFDGVIDLNEGIGALAADHFNSAANLALFHGDTQLAVTSFSVSNPYLSTNKAVTVTGRLPGETAELTLKAWIGASYETAGWKTNWSFTSKPLGGPMADGSVLPIPTMSGWGPEDGSGYKFTPGEEPVVGDDTLVRDRSQPIIIPIDSLLVNDLDPGGGFVTFFSVDAVSNHGLPVSYANGSIRVTPSAVGGGSDYFTYTVSNPQGGLSSGRVDVLVEDALGSINIANQLLRTSDGNGAYNVPVWVDINFNGIRDSNEGIGAFARTRGGAMLGLFLRDSTTPFATAKFDSLGAGTFLADPVFQTVFVPNHPPGTNAPLTIKAWVGASYETAQVRASWDFTSKRLGGARADGTAFAIPDLTGWGHETSQGLALLPGVKPEVFGTTVLRPIGGDTKIRIASIIGNDRDPEGGQLTLASIDGASHIGAVVTSLNGWTYYISALTNPDRPDYFEYTMSNAKGGIARGRVDVLLATTDAQSTTQLSIETEAGIPVVKFRGIPGRSYFIQGRETLDEPWQNLGPAADLGFGLFNFRDTAAAAARYYRVISPL